MVPFAWNEVVQGGCDRYCDERWRKREIEIFNVNRDYKELVEILDIERAEKIVDLPYNETEVTGAVDDDDDIVTYLIVTNNTMGDLTVNNIDEVYDVILWSNSVGYYGIVDKANLNGHYIERENIVELNKNEMFMYSIRLIYDDGG